MAKKYRCAFCDFSVVPNGIKKGVKSSKYIMGEHYERMHKESLPEDMDGFRYFYYLLTKKKQGSCIICKNPTDFNRVTMKYSRFCNNPKCKETYKKEVDGRMLKKYGKVNLLDDPEQQKKMLANRKISGKYKFRDGVEFEYTGTYELDFLKYLDQVLKWKSSDIMSPSPHLYSYTYNGKDHFYIPDFFISSINCEIEIKWDSNGVRNKESWEKEQIKDGLMKSMSNLFNYIKIYNKDYTEFNEFLKNGDE